MHNDSLINFEHMVKQLYEFCEINSGSTNQTGIKQMQDKLIQAFTPLVDTYKIIYLPDTHTISMNGEKIVQSGGSALHFQKRPFLKRRVLLCGHMDTVYDKDHSFQSLKMLDKDRLNGPGVADMKGGLVIMLHALQAFEQSESASSMGWDVIINADEETGSLASSLFMTEVSKKCQAALIFEPAMDEKGLIAKNRKGNGKVTLIATGHSAHAGRDFNSGRNAICYLAEIVYAVNLLNGQREGVTLNVGLINGGTSLNTVPDRAVAKIDIRITFTEDKDWVLDQLHQIQQDYQKEGYTLLIDARFDRPVKRINTATEKLFKLLCSIGQKQEIPIHWQDSGGCCDGNNLAENGLAVIDTLGGCGGNIHTANEYLLLPSLMERAQLTKELLIELSKGQLETINQKEQVQ